MGVRQTSLEALYRIQTQGIPDSQQEMIMILLRYSVEPMTNREIAHALGLEPSTVSARRNELIKKGFIRERGRRKCKINRNYTVLTWEASR